MIFSHMMTKSIPFYFWSIPLQKCGKIIDEHVVLYMTVHQNMARGGRKYQYFNCPCDNCVFCHLHEFSVDKTREIIDRNSVSVIDLVPCYSLYRLIILG